MLLYAGLAILEFFSGASLRFVRIDYCLLYGFSGNPEIFGDICMGFMHSRLWRLVFCMVFKETHKYLAIHATRFMDSRRF